MKKLCIDCYKELHPSEFNELYLISAQKDKCEGCDENKYIVLKENSGYLIFS